MDTTLIVSGMHCESCKALVSMQIADTVLADKLVSVSLQPEHQGEVVLQQVSEAELAQIKEAINALGHYTVND